MPARLYGRNTVLTRINRMLDSLRERRGDALLIEGAPGSGRTRLIDAAEAEARRSGLPTIRVTPATINEPVSSPGLILADDADQLPAEVLDGLLTASRGAAVGVLLAARSVIARPDLHEMLDRARPPVSRCLIEPLTGAAVEQLATDAFGAPPSPELLRWLWTASGEPRLTVALIDGLVEEERVRCDAGQAVSDVGPGLPQRVHTVVRRLLAGLSPQCRQFIYTAAALGPQLDPQRIADMLGGTTAGLLLAWEEALMSEIVVRQGDAVVFAHELLREAVNQLLPNPIREALEVQRQRFAPDGVPDALTAPRVELTPARPTDRLTPREVSVLTLLALGRSNQQIARALNISIHAVKRNVSAILIKLNCGNRTEAALIAVAAQEPLSAGQS